jgi:hypothetical protein
MVVSGALTLASVAADLREGKAAIGEGVRSVDLARSASSIPPRWRCCCLAARGQAAERELRSRIFRKA